MPEKKLPTGDIPFTNKQLLEIEYARCEKDPVYFIKKYVFIQAEEGRYLFPLFKYQTQLISLLQNPKFDRYSILKSRQIGVTTLFAAYSLWFILFKPDMSIMCLAPTQKKAKIILDKVKFAYEELPVWMLKRCGFDNKNELSLILKNGSKIEAASGASESARGFTAHLLFIDEAAFIDNAEDLWGSSQQTLNTTKGKAIAFSTPNGVGGWFHKIHTAAERGEGKFIPIRLPWTKLTKEEDPLGKRTQVWRDEQTVELGERLAKQECDCDFAASGDTIIPPEIIKWYEDTHVREPLDREGNLKDLWIWEYPVPGRDYVQINDVARGDGKDFSTCQIFDLLTNEQVAEYRGQPDTDDFPATIMSLGYRYNTALTVIERESMGWGVVKDAVEDRYPELYWSPKEGMVMDAETYLARNYDYDREKMVPGFSTNVRYRPLVVDSFRSFIEKKVLIIHSKRSVDEWKTFIWGDNSKPRAQKGYNDDLTIPLGIYAFLRDTAFRFAKNSQDLSKAALDHFMVRKYVDTRNPFVAVTNEPKPNAPVVKPKVNPYIMKVKGRDEDISWVV